MLLVKEAVLYFVQDFKVNVDLRPDIGLIYSLLTAIVKRIDLSLLIDYSTYFKDVIQYCRLSVQSRVRLINRGS